MVRVKNKWNQNSAPRSCAQMANAVAGVCFKLASGVVLNLENENFETDTQVDRIEIMEEVACFLIHVIDRRIHASASEGQRRDFITALVRDLARLLEDSRIDVQGPGSYQAAFIERVNVRSSEYSTYGFSEQEGGSFAMRCQLGNQVQSTMGERDNKWIPDYIVGREAPEIENAIKKSLSGLVNFSHSE
ncbi:MAG: hypothetical protein AAF353_18565 [Pseudomonadota bacterium]